MQYSSFAFLTIFCAGFSPRQPVIMCWRTVKRRLDQTSADCGVLRFVFYELITGLFACFPRSHLFMHRHVSQHWIYLYIANCVYVLLITMPCLKRLSQWRFELDSICAFELDLRLIRFDSRFLWGYYRAWLATTPFENEWTCSIFSILVSDQSVANQAL